MSSLDLALVNVRVRTLDPDQPWAGAIGVVGDTIVAVDESTVRELTGTATRVVDMGGACAVPGIVDSHFHPFDAEIHARGVDLSSADTLDEVRCLVAEGGSKTDAEQWVLGFGLRYDAIDTAAGAVAAITHAVAGRAALVEMVDLHTALATPRALELAGVDGPRTFDTHAQVVVDDTGTPTGELREFPAIRLVRAAVPPLSAAERYDLCAAHLKRFAAAGLTGAHGMSGTLDTLTLLRELEANDDLPMRLVMPYWLAPGALAPDDLMHAYAAHRNEAGKLWRTGVIKLFIDGVIDTGTGWLFAPDTHGSGLTSEWSDLDSYVRTVEFFASRGFQIATHATGDRGIHEALNTYRRVGAAPGVRHRIEHIETLDPNDLPRFAAEGVVASMQPQHMIDLEPDRTDHWSRRLGADRCELAFPIRSLIESGAVVTLGSDWPVAHYDWREGMAAAQLRRRPGDPQRAPYDDQTIDALSALNGYTRAPAITSGDDHRLGRVAEGFLADLTVVQQDPVACPPDELIENPVLLTMVGGRIVHDGR